MPPWEKARTTSSFERSAKARAKTLECGFELAAGFEPFPARKKLPVGARRGRITVHGWRKRLALQAESVMPQLEPFCAGFLCTDVDREGTMTGANLEWFRMLRDATAHPIIAAGGIRTQSEIAALEKLGMDAAVGMALYKNQLR